MTRKTKAPVQGAAAALPSATKTEARTARPATEKRADSWTPKSAIFAKEVTHA